MSVAKISLFLSGLFFGGALDHAILGSLGRDVTPYGWQLGVAGNWLLGALDLAIAAGLYAFHRAKEQT